MADIQDSAASTPAGPTDTPDRPTAAQEQTETAPVTTGSDAAISQDETAPESANDDGANDPAKKQKSDVQKRIDSLRRQRGRAERERDQALQELERARAQSQAKESPSPTDAKPQLSDYGSYDDYQEKLTEWKVDQRLKARETEVKQSQQQQRVQTLQAERKEHFQASCEEAREKYDDFDDVVFSDENRMPNWVGGLIADTDNPGEVAYHLAQNPKEAKRIFSLRPEKAALELGRLEVKLNAPKPKLTSSAPPPASTPAGGGRAVQKPAAKMTPDELYAKFKG